MRWGFLVAVALAASIAVSARAVTPEDRAAADQLFKDGRALIKAGNYAEGCKMLASSNALDPTPGTLLALGDCYELNGQTASAWATFTDAQALSRSTKDAKREEEAKRRGAIVEAKLSRIVFEVPPQQIVPGLEVKRNGKPIDPGMVGRPFPVDPGKTLVEVSIPGKVPWSSEVVVPPGPSTTKVPVPVLADGAPGAVPPGGTPPQRSTKTGNAQRIAGVVVGSVGLAGLIVGGVFGGLTIATVNDLEERKLCDDGDKPICKQEGLDLESDANTTANVSNVALAVGGAALITGVIVFVTAPRVKPAPVTVTPVVGSTGGALMVQGAF